MSKICGEDMMKPRTLLISGILFGLVVVFLCLSIVAISLKERTGAQPAEAPTCPPLPKDFSESDLVGTWIGIYFGSTDKLIIRADGTYKQLYSDDTLTFESEWQTWYIEYDPNDYIRLHLAGMRRCDGLESECNNPGGGLPRGTRVINPCDQIAMNYPENEVILFVTGSLSDVPRGIMFQQARLAGSEWTYTFRLIE